MVSTAIIAAVACVLPATKGLPLIAVIAMGLNIADTLFHELGHALFYWLYGSPSIPMIFTIFGADQAGGMAMTWERSWLMQGMALMLLVTACVWTKKFWPEIFLYTLLFTFFIAVTAFTRMHQIVPLFMGHGGAMLMGGFFLFRAWIFLDARNGFERWLNGFFGAFLLIDNMYFCYMLLSDAWALDSYTGHTAFGNGHNDFVKITQLMYSWSVPGVAFFGMIYGVVVLAGSYILALRLRNVFD